MKQKITTLAIIAALSATASATVSMTFSNFITGSYATAGNNGSATGNNGLYWGLIIDGGDGTLTSSYQGGFTFSDDFSATSLTGTNTASDDKLFITDQKTLNFFGNDGSMTALTNVDVQGLNGNKFALVWFDSFDVPSTGTVDNGDNYGMFTDASFVIGAESSNPDFSTVFTGNSDARAANLTFQAVPEPSSTALLGLGSVALLLRRRR